MYVSSFVMCGPLPPQSKCHAPFWNVVLIPFGGYIISSSTITHSATDAGRLLHVCIVQCVHGQIQYVEEEESLFTDEAEDRGCFQQKRAGQQIVWRPHVYDRPRRQAKLGRGRVSTGLGWK